MTQYQSGADALNALNAVPGENNAPKKEFAKLGAGASRIVKILSIGDVARVFSYGNYGRGINSFVAKEPSIKSDKGFPKDKLTPFDKAYLYHKERSKERTDAEGVEASVYKPKERFIMGFYDLDEKKYIALDLSGNQARGIAPLIKKNEAKLGKKAFEISKSPGTSGVITINPLDLDDLTPEQLTAFEGAPAVKDDDALFGLFIEKDEKEMVDELVRVGFDVKKIGFDNASTPPSTDDLESDELPF